MNAVLDWLRRLMALPKLSWGSVLAVYAFLFIGQPMLATIAERLVDAYFPDAPLGGVGWFFGIFMSLLFVTWIIVWRTGVFTPVRPKGLRNPDPAKIVVMLASSDVPDASYVASFQQIRGRREVFEAVERLKDKNKSHGWLELVARSLEWHRARVERLVLLVSKDGLGGAGSPQRRSLVDLLDHYVRESLGWAVEIHLQDAGHSSDPNEVFREVEALQYKYRDQDDAIVFDFTGGTKPMSAGMVMACLEDRFPLQYFLQITQAPQEPALQVGCGQPPAAQG